MNQMKENKVCEGRVTDFTPELDTLTYREKNYPVRKISDGQGDYVVSVESLQNELLDGIRSSDPFAFEIDESICYYCTEEQIRTLGDEELIEIIYG